MAWARPDRSAEQSSGRGGPERPGRGLAHPWRPEDRRAAEQRRAHQREGTARARAAPSLEEGLPAGRVSPREDVLGRGRGRGATVRTGEVETGGYLTRPAFLTGFRRYELPFYQLSHTDSSDSGSPSSFLPGVASGYGVLQRAVTSGVRV